MAATSPSGADCERRAGTLPAWRPRRRGGGAAAARTGRTRPPETDRPECAWRPRRRADSAAPDRRPRPTRCLGILSKAGRSFKPVRETASQPPNCNSRSILHFVEQLDDLLHRRLFEPFATLGEPILEA